MPSASIIIPTYNGLAYLQECLRSLRPQLSREVEAVVVDNASTDGTAAFVQEWYPEVRVVRAAQNLGFSGAGNLGAAAAQGTWLIFLNNDTVVEPDWLPQLLAVVQRDEGLGACTSKIRLMRDPTRLDSIGSYLTRTGFLQHIGLLERDQGQYDGLTEIFSPKGVAFAIRRSLFASLGGFDERYFAYFEESDLFWRVWLRGFRIGVAPRSMVYHRVGGTASRFQYAFVDYHSFKNRLCTILKNAEWITLGWMVPFHLVCCVGLALINGLRPRRWPNAWAILRALAWNLQHLGKTLRAREAIQRTRKVSDRELFQHILRPMPIGEFARYTGWMVVSRERMRERLTGLGTVAESTR